MENIIKRTSSIKSGFKAALFLGGASIIAGALMGLGVFYFSSQLVSEARNEVYILDHGSAEVARRTDAGTNRELEVRDHVIRFHELMFNLSPSSEAIKANIEKALIMSDRSVYNYWQDQSESGFYSRLVSANISQQVALDSLSTNCREYPYTAKYYGRLFIIRESNITSYRFSTSCQLVDINRSENNPHGLIIEKFSFDSSEKIGTRKRQ